jgi:hypothetical protein
MDEYLYFYRHTDTNHRRVILMPKEAFFIYRGDNSNIKGIFLSEERVSVKDHDFPIRIEDDIAEKYRGKFIKFEDFG